MSFVMKMVWFIQYMYLIKNFKNAWIYCSQQIKTSCIMSISKTLNDLCVTRQKIRIRNTFTDIGYCFLVTKNLERT